MTLSETTLDELLSDETTRAALIRDAEAVLDRRVAASRGMTGMAVRAGYAAFRRVQPGIVPSALRRLAPHFAPVMDRHWAEARTQAEPAAHFANQSSAIAADLLAVTDGMAQRANSQVLASIYTSLRGRAEHEVAAAMPEVADLLQRHLG